MARDQIPAHLRARPFSRRDGLEYLSLAQLRGDGFRRLGRGVYWVADGTLDLTRRIEAARAVLPEEAVLGGLSAAAALGSPWSWDTPAAPQPVEVVLPHQRRARSRRGLVVRGDVLTADEIVATPFGWATSPARTACDLARRSGSRPHQLADAVAQIDAVLHVGGIDVDAARQRLRPGARGCRVAARVLDLAHPGAESPPESRLRVHIALAGLPAPLVQFELRDEWGRVVYRLDLAWPAVRRALEYDGQQHRLDDGQYLHDIDRYNRLASGWQVRRVIAPHMRNMPLLLRQIRDMLEAA